nr:type II secretion system F family protein [Neptunicella marina]
MEGEVEALSEQEAVRQLAQMRIEVFHIESYVKSKKRGKKVSVADLAVPLQELATLTESGVTLVEAVKALAQNDEHPLLAEGFAKIVSLIESGESFSTAISESTLPFPEYVSHLVAAGELSGQLATSLRKASYQLNYEQSVKSDVKSALTYPVVLICAGLAAMLIIFFAVVPKFSHLLDSGKNLPALATAVLSAGRYVNDSAYTVFGLVGAIVISLIVLFANKTVQQKLKDLAIELPVIGPWLSEQDAARWAALCSAMLLARVNLIAALKLASASCEYTRRKARAHVMIDDIESGMSFTEALSRARLVPRTSQNLVSVGDKTGQLAEMLDAVAALHDTSCKRRMKQVLTLMEPIAILIVGCLLGVMILGIVQAITASTDIAI